MSFAAPFPHGIPRGRSAPRLRVGLLGLFGLACWCIGSAAPAAAPVVPQGAAEGVPVYATRLPGPSELDYELRYGPLSGSGRLVWQPPIDGRYRARLVGSALGLNLLTWQSEGTVDAAGLAPLRFTERRLNRAEDVVEFDHGTRKIRYARKPGAELPLPAGTQDRLSWMLQLPAILEAQPSLRRPGSTITLYVTSSRRGAEPWTFVVQARVPVTLMDGRVADAVHLRRVPQEADDVLGEAWLDPAREHLPVRVRLSNADGGSALEFRLRGIRTP